MLQLRILHSMHLFNIFAKQNFKNILHIKASFKDSPYTTQIYLALNAYFCCLFCTKFDDYWYL